MPILRYSSKEEFACTVLGTSTRKFLRLAVTVNLSPKLIIPYKLDNKKRKIPYGVLRPVQQVNFLKEYIDEVYKPLADSMEFHFELCKSGTVHMHGTLYIEDDNDKRAKFWESDIRAQVKQSSYVNRLLKPKHIVTANHIVVNDKDQWDRWSEYINKDDGIIPVDPIYLIPLK